jgi:hypothetical protein
MGCEETGTRSLWLDVQDLPCQPTATIAVESFF